MVLYGTKILMLSMLFMVEEILYTNQKVEKGFFFIEN